MFLKNFPKVKTLLLEVMEMAGWDIDRGTLAWGLFNHVLFLLTHFPTQTAGYITASETKSRGGFGCCCVSGQHCGSTALRLTHDPMQSTTDIHSSDTHGNMFGPAPTQKKSLPW